MLKGQVADLSCPCGSQLGGGRGSKAARGSEYSPAPSSLPLPGLPCPSRARWARVVRRRRGHPKIPASFAEAAGPLRPTAAPAPGPVPIGRLAIAGRAEADLATR